MNRCLICNKESVYGDLCKGCWLGLKCFERNCKLLARAITYLGPKRKLRTKRQRRESRKRSAEISRLVEQQRTDANDRTICFDHALNQ